MAGPFSAAACGGSAVECYVALCRDAGTECCLEVLSALTTGNTVCSLTDRATPLQDVDIQCLAGVLRRFNAFDSLNVEGNDIGPDGVLHIANTLQGSTGLATLRLGANKFRDGGVITLAHALTSNASLTSLDLSHNRVGGVGAKALASLLAEGSALEELVLHGNVIDSAAVEYIARGLRHNVQLQHLHLGYNDIGSRGIEVLARLVAQNGALITLDVSNNRITDTECAAFAAALIPTEEQLQASRTALSAGLRAAPPPPPARIERLNLRANLLAEKAFLALARCVVAPGVQLRELFVGYNAPPPHAVDELITAAAHAPTLRTLDVHGCPVTNVAPIVHLLSTNPAFTCLLLDGVGCADGAAGIHRQRAAVRDALADRARQQVARQWSAVFVGREADRMDGGASEPAFYELEAQPAPPARSTSPVATQTYAVSTEGSATAAVGVRSASGAELLLPPRGGSWGRAASYTPTDLGNVEDRIHRKSSLLCHRGREGSQRAEEGTAMVDAAVGDAAAGKGEGEGEGELQDEVRRLEMRLEEERTAHSEQLRRLEARLQALEGSSRDSLDVLHGGRTLDLTTTAKENTAAEENTTAKPVETPQAAAGGTAPVLRTVSSTVEESYTTVVQTQTQARGVDIAVRGGDDAAAAVANVPAATVASAAAPARAPQLQGDADYDREEALDASGTDAAHAHECASSEVPVDDRAADDADNTVRFTRGGYTAPAPSPSPPHDDAPAGVDTTTATTAAAIDNYIRDRNHALDTTRDTEPQDDACVPAAAPVARAAVTSELPPIVPGSGLGSGSYSAPLSTCDKTGTSAVARLRASRMGARREIVEREIARFDAPGSGEEEQGVVVPAAEPPAPTAAGDAVEESCAPPGGEEAAGTPPAAPPRETAMLAAAIPAQPAAGVPHTRTVEATVPAIDASRAVEAASPEVVPPLLTGMPPHGVPATTLPLRIPSPQQQPPPLQRRASSNFTAFASLEAARTAAMGRHGTGPAAGAPPAGAAAAPEHVTAVAAMRSALVAHDAADRGVDAAGGPVASDLRRRCLVPPAAPAAGGGSFAETLAAVSARTRLVAVGEPGSAFAPPPHPAPGAAGGPAGVVARALPTTGGSTRREAPRAVPTASAAALGSDGLPLLMPMTILQSKAKEAVLAERAHVGVACAVAGLDDNGAASGLPARDDPTVLSSRVAAARGRMPLHGSSSSVAALRGGYSGMHAGARRGVTEHDSPSPSRSPSPAVHHGVGDLRATPVPAAPAVDVDALRSAGTRIAELRRQLSATTSAFAHVAVTPQADRSLLTPATLPVDPGPSEARAATPTAVAPSGVPCVGVLAPRPESIDRGPLPDRAEPERPRLTRLSPPLIEQRARSPVRSAHAVPLRALPQRVLDSPPVPDAHDTRRIAPPPPMPTRPAAPPATQQTTQTDTTTADAEAQTSSRGDPADGRPVSPPEPALERPTPSPPPPQWHTRASGDEEPPPCTPPRHAAAGAGDACTEATVAVTPATSTATAHVVTTEDRLRALGTPERAPPPVGFDAAALTPPSAAAVEATEARIRMVGRRARGPTSPPRTCSPGAAASGHYSDTRAVSRRRHGSPLAAAGSCDPVRHNAEVSPHRNLRGAPDSVSPSDDQATLTILLDDDDDSVMLRSSSGKGSLTGAEAKPSAAAPARAARQTRSPPYAPGASWGGDSVRSGYTSLTGDVAPPPSTASQRVASLPPPPPPLGAGAAPEVPAGAPHADAARASRVARKESRSPQDTHPQRGVPVAVRAPQVRAPVLAAASVRTAPHEPMQRGKSPRPVPANATQTSIASPLSRRHVPRGDDTPQQVQWGAPAAAAARPGQPAREASLSATSHEGGALLRHAVVWGHGAAVPTAAPPLRSASTSARSYGTAPAKSPQRSSRVRRPTRSPRPVGVCGHHS